MLGDLKTPAWVAENIIQGERNAMWAPVTQLSEAVPQGFHQAGNEELSRRDFIRLAVDKVTWLPRPAQK